MTPTMTGVMVLLGFAVLIYWVISIITCCVTELGESITNDFIDHGSLFGFFPWIMFLFVVFPFICFPIYLIRLKTFKLKVLKFGVFKFISSFFVLNYRAIVKVIKYEHT